MIVHRISTVSLVALKSENLSMVGTGSYYILCIEYNLHYNVTSLVLGGCQILTLEASRITEKAPCMYNGYLYSKDDLRSPFVKPPCLMFIFNKMFLGNHIEESVELCQVR
jgi:hypothetical protein